MRKYTVVPENNLLRRRQIKELGPIISSSKLFSKAKFVDVQKKIEYHTKNNLRLITFINETKRFKGKADCFNPDAALRNSKLPFRINEQKRIKIENKKISEVLKEIGKTKRFANFAPFKVRTDLNLENPPSLEEYERGKKVSFQFKLANQTCVGTIDVLFNKENPQIIKEFLTFYSQSFKDCKVHKIIEGLLIETGDTSKSCECKTQTNFFGENKSNSKVMKHLHSGSVLMMLEKDGSTVKKFCITLKKLPIYDAQQFVVIGRVVKGLDVLQALNQFGSRFGVPKQTILMESCGMFK